MKLEKMRYLADARTKGDWEHVHIFYGEERLRMGDIIDDENGTRRHEGWVSSESDAKFILMCSKEIDKLLAVVEAAKTMFAAAPVAMTYEATKLKVNLEELEKEI